MNGMKIKLKLEFNDGIPRFMPETIEDVALRSWTEELMPEELIEGRVVIEMDAVVEAWGEDGGPILRVGESI